MATGAVAAAPTVSGESARAGLLPVSALTGSAPAADTTSPILGPTPTADWAEIPGAPASDAPSEPDATPSPTVSASPSQQPAPTVREYPVGSGTEPSTAADPAHPGVVAVVSEVMTTQQSHPCSRPMVRISQDGGATWAAPVYPWKSCVDIHAVVAWGPGSRLWAGNAVSSGAGVRMSVTFSDDLGKTWSKPFVERFTPPWGGCFPEITVDNWPASPNFGTVYVTYNWLASEHGPGVSVMASRDGSKWIHAEVPLDAAMPRYPYSWRFGYRVQAAPDGTAIVSFYQSNLAAWQNSTKLDQGAGSNIGRMGFETARIQFDGASLSIDPPVWASAVDHPDAEFQSQLANDGAGRTWLAIENRGRIQVGPLDGTWREISVTGKYSFKPVMAVSGRTVFVGWHARDKSGHIWTYYTLSYDGGQTFLPPALASQAWWSPRSADVVNGVGLRENADFENGVIYWAYGDARHGLNIYMAAIRP